MAFLITANCNDGTAKSAYLHFKKCMTPIFNLKQISAICTDDAAYYKGSRSGMVQLIKTDQDFNSNIIICLM